MTEANWIHETRVVRATHIIKGFGPGSDPPGAVQAPQESVAQHVDSHRQRVDRGAVERNAVFESLLREKTAVSRVAPQKLFIWNMSSNKVTLLDPVTLMAALWGAAAM